VQGEDFIAADRIIKLLGKGNFISQGASYAAMVDSFRGPYRDKKGKAFFPYL
jgi:hypothetical protein